MTETKQVQLQISREEFMEILLNGLKLSKSATLDDDAKFFYFQSLDDFINSSENEFWSELVDDTTIIVSYENTEIVALELEEENRVFLKTLAESSIIDMDSVEAKSLGWLVVGLVIFNETWKEANNEETRLTGEETDNMQDYLDKAKHLEASIKSSQFSNLEEKQAFYKSIEVTASGLKKNVYHFPGIGDIEEPEDMDSHIKKPIKKKNKDFKSWPIR
jgi:hypothetical protein